MSPTTIRLRGRRSLVPLAGLLALALVTNGVIGLFGVWSIHRQHEQALAAGTALVEELDRARAVQVSFKTQVQEWKNMLLRGSDPADLQRYRAAFDAEAVRVRDGLGALAGRPGANPDYATLRTEHASLMQRYAAALTQFQPADPHSARAVDAAVRGIDRRLLDETDALIERLLAHAATTQREAQATVRERYEALRRTFVWGLAACILLVGLFLWLAIQGEKRD